MADKLHLQSLSIRLPATATAADCQGCGSLSPAGDLAVRQATWPSGTGDLAVRHTHTRVGGWVGSGSLSETRRLQPGDGPPPQRSSLPAIALGDRRLHGPEPAAGYLSLVTAGTAWCLSQRLRPRPCRPGASRALAGARSPRPVGSQPVPTGMWPPPVGRSSRPARLARPAGPASTAEIAPAHHPCRRPRQCDCGLWKAFTRPRSGSRIRGRDSR